MKFLCRALMPDTSKSEGLVVVNLNKKEREVLLRHRAMATALDMQDKEFLGIEFEDTLAVWYAAAGYANPLDGEEPAPAMAAPRVFVPPTDEFSTVFQRYRVSVQGVSWSAHIDVLGARVHTEFLPWSLLDKS